MLILNISFEHNPLITEKQKLFRHEQITQIWESQNSPKSSTFFFFIFFIHLLQKQSRFSSFFNKIYIKICAVQRFYIIDLFNFIFIIISFRYLQFKK